MQILKNLLLTVVSIATLFSCVDEVEPTVGKITPRQPDESLSGNFLLKTDEIIVSDYDPETIIKVKLKGEGKLQDLGYSQLDLTHKKMVGFNKGQAKIYDGKMTIKVESGSELHGKYVLYGLNEKNFQDIRVNVSSCTGKFKDAFGSIKIHMTPRSDEITSADVKGTLFYGENSAM